MPMWMISHQNDPEQILKDAYCKAKEEFDKDKGKSFLENLCPKMRMKIEVIGRNPEKHKAVVAVLTTLLVKKIETPNQDIRYHRTDLEGGFSGRSYDTKYVTPFIKENFGTRFAMRESGWLTRSFEKPEPFLLSYQGRIQPEEVKKNFLQILDEVQREGVGIAERYLIALFIHLLRRKETIEYLRSKIAPPISQKEMAINLIIDLLRQFFSSTSRSSKLPVIAIYAIYKILIKEVIRYKDKKLKQLRSHYSPDQFAGLGDVEVIDEVGEYFEIVEVKHNIPISKEMLIDVQSKIEKMNKIRVQRYYILTTAEPYVKQGDEREIQQLVNLIKKKYGCEIEINGVIQTIRYYLRLITNPSDFIKYYTEILTNDPEVEEEHLKTWQKLANQIIGS